MGPKIKDTKIILAMKPLIPENHPITRQKIPLGVMKSPPMPKSGDFPKNGESEQSDYAIYSVAKFSRFSYFPRKTRDFIP